MTGPSKKKNMYQSAGHQASTQNEEKYCPSKEVFSVFLERVIIITLVMRLGCGRCCSRHFTGIAAFDPHNSLLLVVILIL